MRSGVRSVVIFTAILLACSGFTPFASGAHLPSRARVTKRAANPNGKVLILMYHNFGPTESRYVRSYAHFKDDLQNLYDLGFRPVTMSQYISNDMPLPPGASPVVITMDDSAPTQFQVDKTGAIDPHCAVGMWHAFAVKHPDFPVRGTFYVLPPIMWMQHAWRHHKVRLLKAWGSELACHTWSHPALRYLSDARVEQELGRSMDFLAALGFDDPSLAFPYGIYPRHRALLKGFEYKKRHYRLTAAVTCDPELAPPPEFAEKHPYELPRIEARRGFMALDYWMPQFKHSTAEFYVAP